MPEELLNKINKNKEYNKIEIEQPLPNLHSALNK
jgi:hypothetical protein